MESLKDLNFLILGGDERFVELSKLYYIMGFNISTFALENSNISYIKEHETIESALNCSDIIIGPIPFNNGEKINTMLSKKTVLITDLLDLIKKTGKILALGSPDKEFIKLADSFDIQYFDYNSEETFKVLNAIPTAEGAIAEIINNTNTTINGSKMLILGYGRIGKALSDCLNAFNPNLSIAVRKNIDATWINTKGFKAVNMSNIENIIYDIDVLINTVPERIIDNHLIDKIKRNALILDLASKPGGLEHSYASSKGIKTIHALGLPSKTAPKTAAKYIYDTINGFLNS